MLNVGDRVKHKESGRAGTIDEIRQFMVDDPDHPRAVAIRVRLDGTGIPVRVLPSELTPLRHEPRRQQH